MADRFVVGDTVTLSNTFAVAGTATTYTYAGATITKSSTGVYTKSLIASAVGIYLYTWKGTATAADVSSGSFTVWAVTETVDVLTLSEARQAVGLTSDESDDYLKTLITAVSTQLDEMCGPVRTRTVTDELHDGGSTSLLLRNARSTRSRPSPSTTARPPRC